MKPPPPIPHDWGRATLSAKTVAAAASIALPPACRTPRPTRAAAGDSLATTPSAPVTPVRNCEPCLAPAGTAETATRAIVTARAVLRTAESYPGCSGSCVRVYGFGQPRAQQHAEHEPGDRGRDMDDRLVADQPHEARRVLDVARRRRRREAVGGGGEQSESESRRAARAEGEVGHGMGTVVPPVCLHRHEHRAPARAPFSG